MKYLSEITLKTFLVCLYGKGYIEIPTRLRVEKDNFIKNIYENNLQKYFTLTRNDELFKDIDYKNFFDADYIDYYLINCPLKIALKEVHRDETYRFVNEYINNFVADNLYLDSPTAQYFNFKESFTEVSNILNSYSKGLNKKSSVKIKIEENSKNRFYNKEIRFFEVILYLANEKIINIDSCNVIKDYKKIDIDEQKIDLKFTPRKDINSIIIPTGDSEEKRKQTEEIICQISYDNFSRDISINGYKLITLRYDSPNKVIFEYLFKHPDEYIEKEKLEELILKELKEPLKKPLTKFADEVGLKGKRRKLFFTTTKDTAKLRTKITKEQLEAANIKLSEILPEK